VDWLAEHLPQMVTTPHGCLLCAVLLVLGYLGYRPVLSRVKARRKKKGGGA